MFVRTSCCPQSSDTEPAAAAEQTGHHTKLCYDILDIVSELQSDISEVKKIMTLNLIINVTV